MASINTGGWDYIYNQYLVTDDSTALLNYKNNEGSSFYDQIISLYRN